MSEINADYPVIDALCGIDTASPQISQYTDGFGKIKFMLGKNFDGYTLMIITDIKGHVEIVKTDGENLVQETDEQTGETSLLWNIGAEVTVSHGVVVYQIVGYKSENGDIVSTWYSKEGRLIVTESIDTTSYSTELAGAHPNLITQLIVECGQMRLLCENKVDQEDGKGLSTCDFTEEEKEKLFTVKEEAQKNVQSDWNENDETSDCFIKNKPSVDTAFDKKSNNALANSVVAAEFEEFGNVVEQMGKDLDGAKQEIEQGAEYAEGTRNDLVLHRANEYADEQHLTAQEKQNIQNISINVDSIIEEIERVDESIGDVRALYAEEVKRLDRVSDDVIATEKRVDVLEAIPKTEVPTTLEVNTAYNFGSQNATLTLTFPSIANDGDVIYIGFVCREGLNLVVDTTNTFDFDLIPEKNTGYEIYAKCTTNLGMVRWILKYSEYSGVGE